MFWKEVVEAHFKVLYHYLAIETYTFYYVKISAQAVRHRSLTAETGVNFRLTSCEIRGDRSGIEEGYLRASSLSSLLITPSLLRSHPSPPPEVCDSPDHAAHYHILGLKFWASSLTRKLSGYKLRKVI
jgi:hypothetical protein